MAVVDMGLELDAVECANKGDIRTWLKPIGIFLLLLCVRVHCGSQEFDIAGCSCECCGVYCRYSGEVAD